MRINKTEILKFILYSGALLLDKSLENRKETLKNETIRFIEKLDIDLPFPVAFVGMIIDFFIDKIIDFVDESID
ncbi:MAG: hypothetical protein PWQ20_1487 [Thermotogaceae bacterium]|jgi:hypothetical protein|nr:hypothetical protein [Thermotogaceae bacterium]MDN5338417.1 hypothetical protein [Thermotogaceae bacterium]